MSLQWLLKRSRLTIEKLKLSGSSFRHLTLVPKVIRTLSSQPLSVNSRISRVHPFILLTFRFSPSSRYGLRTFTFKSPARRRLNFSSGKKSRFLHTSEMPITSNLFANRLERRTAFGFLSNSIS